MATAPTLPQPPIRVGIGGWTFEPWRGSFYPPGLPHDEELAFASRHLRVIEINGTYYRLQSPTSFARWRGQTPDGFVFSLKAPRFVTQRRVLGEAGEAVQRFIQSGLAELGDKLGPVVWQLPPTHRFEPDDLAAFFALLPQKVGGLPLRHVLDPRHESFRSGEYLALARAHGITTVFTDGEDYPPVPDPTGPFVYARLMRTEPQHAWGCTPEALDALAACAHAWRRGAEPTGLPRVAPAPAAALEAPREVFLFFISAAKDKAPLAARALQQRVDAHPWIA